MAFRKAELELKHGGRQAQRRWFTLTRRSGKEEVAARLEEGGQRCSCAVCFGLFGVVRAESSQRRGTRQLNVAQGYSRQEAASVKALFITAASEEPSKLQQHPISLSRTKEGASLPPLPPCP